MPRRAAPNHEAVIGVGGRRSRHRSNPRRRNDLLVAHFSLIQNQLPQTCPIGEACLQPGIESRRPALTFGPECCRAIANPTPKRARQIGGIALPLVRLGDHPAHRGSDQLRVGILVTKLGARGLDRVGRNRGFLDLVRKELLHRRPIALGHRIIVQAARHGHQIAQRDGSASVPLPFGDHTTQRGIYRRDGPVGLSHPDHQAGDALIQRQGLCPRRRGDALGVAFIDALSVNQDHQAEPAMLV